MKGLKIRVMESPVMVDSLNAMGAQAVAMAWPEVFTALQQGTIGWPGEPGHHPPHESYHRSHAVRLDHQPLLQSGGGAGEPRVVEELSDFDRQVFQRAGEISRDHMRWFISHYSEDALRVGRDAVQEQD